MQFTPITRLVTHISGNITDETFALFRPCINEEEGYFYDILALDEEEVSGISFPVISLNSPLAAAPISYTAVYDYNEFRSAQKFTFFKPVPPPGFTALGVVVAESLESIPRGILCLSSALCGDCTCLTDGLSENADIVSQCETAASNETSVIKIFNPFGVYTELFRTQLLQSDIGRAPPAILEKAIEKHDFSCELSEIADHIGFASSSNVVFPIMNFSGCKDFTPSLLPDDDENDNMSDLSISEIDSGCGMQLSNFAAIRMRESEYFQPAEAFELIGVTSITKPTEQADEEKYIFVFKPIPPPGYVALSLVLSETEEYEGAVYCAAEHITLRTSRSTDLGRIYSGETASYILNYLMLCNSGEDLAEITRRERKLGNVEPEEIEIVVPRGSLGCVEMKGSDGYEILSPTVLAFINCLVSVSEKSLMRGIKQGKEGELVAEFELPSGRSLRVFQPRLEKSHHCTVIESFNIKDGTAFDFNAFSKPDQRSQCETQKSQRKSEIEKPESLPIELSIIAHSAQFDFETLAEPEDYVVVADEGRGVDRVRLISLVPPPGFCALSDVAWAGDEDFDKSLYACVNSSFCQIIKAKPVCAVSDRFELAEAALSYGTLELQQSEFKCLRFLKSGFDFDSYNMYILKDNVFQAHAQQEQLQSRVKYQGRNVTFDKENLEVELLSKSVIELSTREFQLFKRVQIINVTDQQSLSFGSLKVAVTPNFGSETSELSHAADSAAQDIYENYAEMSGENADDSSRKVLLTTFFNNEIAPCGLWAKPKALERVGSFEDEGTTFYIFKIIANDNFVTLGDIITEEELLQAERFVTVHKSLVTYTRIDDPPQLLSGYFEANGIWMYHSSGSVFAYDFPEESITVPILKPALVRAASNQLKHSVIYPHNDGLAVVDPMPYYNLFVSFSHNNKISMSALKLFDFGMNEFDTNAVNDPLCKTAAFVSLSNIRLYNTNQRLTAEIIEPALKPEQLALQMFSNEQVESKARLLVSLYDILEALQLATGFNYFGKRAHITFPISDCGFVALTDKIPLSPGGGYFLGHGCLVKHCIFEKFCAKCIGSYNKMYDMDASDLVRMVLDLFGMNTRNKGSWIFDLYIHEGQISVNEEDGSAQIRVWKE